MSALDILAPTNGNGKASVSPEVSSTENQSRDGLPSGFKGLIAKRRGVKPGTKRGSYNKGSQSSADTQSSPTSSALFTPENVRPLVSLPFNLALAKTGFTGFALSEGEAATLSATGSVALNQWVTIDPRYVALILFSMSMITISAEKVALYSRAKAEEDQKLKEGNGEQTTKS